MTVTERGERISRDGVGCALDDPGSCGPSRAPLPFLFLRDCWIGLPIVHVKESPFVNANEPHRMFAELEGVVYPRTVGSVLTGCLTEGVHPTVSFMSEDKCRGGGSGFRPRA